MLREGLKGLNHLKIWINVPVILHVFQVAQILHHCVIHHRDAEVKGVHEGLQHVVVQVEQLGRELFEVGHELVHAERHVLPVHPKILTK